MMPLEWKLGYESYWCGLSEKMNPWRACYCNDPVKEKYWKDGWEQAQKDDKENSPNVNS